MSQYQRRRSGSKNTSCGATSTFVCAFEASCSGCGRSVTVNGPAGWSDSLGGANGGSHVPAGSGAVRASGKFVRFGETPDTNGLSHTGSLPHCVTKFFSGWFAGAVIGSSAKDADGTTTASISP